MNHEVVNALVVFSVRITIDYMNSIVVKTLVHSPVQIVWAAFTTPLDIEQWNHASSDWECRNVQNDLAIGGTFSSTMSAKDGSMSFVFTGVYSEIIHFQKIAYSLGDGRQITITFEALSDNETEVIKTFDLESENSIEKQQEGWQAIFDNFRSYVESKDFIPQVKK